MLESRNVDKYMRGIKKTIDDNYAFSNGQSTVKFVIQEWYNGKESLLTKPNKAQTQLFAMTETIREALKMDARILMSFDDGPDAPQIDLSSLKLNESSHIKVEIAKTTITLKIRASATTTKTVVWGVYPWKNPRYSGPDYYLSKEVLFCDIDNLFLRGELNPLRGHEIPGVRYSN